MGCFLRPGTPKSRSAATEGLATLDAQRQTAPGTLALEQQYRPEYADVSADTLSQYLTGNDANGAGVLGILPWLSDASREISSAGRTGLADDLVSIAPAVREASQVANPELWSLLGRLSTEANAELDAGAGLDPSLSREISQGVRSAQAARGMGYGPADVTAEVFARGERGEALRRNRQGFASGVAQLLGGAQQNPLAAATSASEPSTALSLLGSGQAGSSAAAPTLFDPFSAYAADVYNTNYNADAAAKLAASNNMAGVVGGAIGGL